MVIIATTLFIICMFLFHGIVVGIFLYPLLSALVAFIARSDGSITRKIPNSPPRVWLLDWNNRVICTYIYGYDILYSEHNLKIENIRIQYASY